MPAGAAAFFDCDERLAGSGGGGGDDDDDDTNTSTNIYK